MKLFMQSFYDNPGKRRTLQNPMDYEVICIGCAGLLGGKMMDNHRAIFHTDTCDCCEQRKAVAEPRDYIWRT